MTRTLIARIFLGLGLTFGVFGFAAASSAQEIEILDIITDKQLEELDIEIPAETPFGYNELIIDVYEEDEVVVSKRIGFCKENDGFINWNNQCAGPTAVDPEPQVVSVSKSKLAGEDLLVRGSVAISIVLLFGALVMGLSTQSVPFKPNQLRSGLSLSVRDVSKSLRSLSHLMARVSDDGAWLRSKVGYASLSIYLAGAGTVIVGIEEINREQLPLASSWTLLLLLIGAIDALAGVYAALLYLLVMLTQGGISEAGDLVVVTLFILLVAFVRPFANIVSERFSSASNSGNSRFSNAFKVAIVTLVISLLLLELISFVTIEGVEVVEDSLLIASAATVIALLRSLLASADIDYEPSEGFAPVVRWSSGRVIDIVLATALTLGLVGFFYSGSILLWPVLVLVLIFGLAGMRAASRSE